MKYPCNPLHRLGLGLLLVALAGACQADAPAASGVDTVEVDGEAVIYQGDVPRARRRALDEAFNAALTRLMGTWISAESFTHNYQSIDRGVYGRTQGYIKTYEILARSETGELLSLRVRVTVSTEQIKNDLAAMGILLDRLDNPILVVTGSDAGLAASQSSPVLRKALLAQGIQVLDAGDTMAADVVVRLEGRLQNQTRMPGVGMHGAVVSLRAQAYWRQEQRLLVSEETLANGAGITATAALSQAYRDAATRLAPALVARLIEKWRAEVNDSRVITVAVNGSHAQVRRFVARLGRVFGVRKASLKRYRDGEAELMLRFTGSASLLADLIARTRFEGLRSEIVEVGQGRVGVVLSPTSLPTHTGTGGIGNIK
jgi:predicted small secreted protein